MSVDHRPPEKQQVPDCDFCKSGDKPLLRYFGNTPILTHATVADNGNETEYLRCPFKEYKL